MIDRLTSEPGEEVRIQIYAPGVVDHHNGAVIVDQKMATGLSDSMAKLARMYGYYPPLTAEHPEIFGEFITSQPDVAGIQFGLIVDVEHSEEKGVEVVAKLNRLGQMLWEMGALVYFSPSIYREWTDPHTGETLGPVLREVSAVGVPHQKNVASENVGRVYSMSERPELHPAGFAEAKPAAGNTEETNMEKLEEMLEELAKRLGTLEETVTALSGDDSEDTGEDEESVDAMEDEDVAMEEDDESTDMAERLLVMEHKVARADAIEAVREDLPGVDRQMAVDMAELRLASKPRYQRMLKALKETKDAPPAPRGNSQPGEAVHMSESRVVSMAEEAAKNGVKRGMGFIKFMTARGVGRAEQARILSDHKQQIDNVYDAFGGEK